MRLQRRRSIGAPAGARRLLVPFAGGSLDPAALDAALRVAKADSVVFVPAYLIIVPLTIALDSPLRNEVEVALPVLDALELAAHRQGVAVDARLERGRARRQALQRRWSVEPFDRILIPVSADDRAGFSELDVARILMHASTRTLALRPASSGVRRADAAAANRRWHMIAAS